MSGDIPRGLMIPRVDRGRYDDVWSLEHDNRSDAETEEHSLQAKSLEDVQYAGLRQFNEGEIGLVFEDSRRCSYAARLLNDEVLASFDGRREVAVGSRQEEAMGVRSVEVEDLEETTRLCGLQDCLVHHVLFPLT